MGSMKPRIIFYGALLGAQACIGMWMVNSGLEDDPDSAYIPRVSSYRLATHLFGALFLYTNLLWSSLQHLLPTATDAANFRKTKNYKNGSFCQCKCVSHIFHSHG